MLTGLLFWLSVAFILYVYLGYPALVTAGAMLSRRPELRADAEYCPSLTLLICAYNEQEVIRAKLENSLALDYPAHDLQILVVADGSDDATPDLVAEYAHRGVELLHQPQRKGKMAAIDRAMASARGEIVVFSDANNFYDSDALRELVRPFAHADVGAATGAKRIMRGDGALGDSEGLYWRYESFIKRMETRLGSCVSVAGEILALRRELYRRPPDGIINDDFHLAMQVLGQGRRLVYVPQAISRERVSPTQADEVRRRARIVAGRWQAMALAPAVLSWKRPLLAWQLVSHKFFRPLVPLAMAMALAANLLALVLLLAMSDQAIPDQAQVESLWRLSGHWAWWAMAAQAVFYLLAAVGALMPSRGVLGKLDKLLYLPRFLVASNWAAMVGLFHFLGGRQGHLWARASRREGLARH